MACLDKRVKLLLVTDDEDDDLQSPSYHTFALTSAPDNSAYSVMTCSPSTRIVWRAPSVVNKCRVTVSLADGLKADCLGDATLMKVFPSAATVTEKRVEGLQV